MKRLGRLAILAAALGVGWLLLGARPREVVLVYDVAAVPGATALEVEVRTGAGEVLRRARLAVRPGAELRHPVRLRDGSYALAWRLEAPGGAVEGARPLEVSGDETIVLPLGS